MGPGLAVLAIATAVAGTGSCILSPRETLTISGRLSADFGCLTLRSNGRNYELHEWEDPIPPLGSWVALRVTPLHNRASICMAGKIVDVIDVLGVRTDFRTQAIVGTETWTADQGPIVLGRVEVRPGATLTIAPGTTVQITRFGELRVRGTLHMVGTASESILVIGWSEDGSSPGPIVLESAQPATRIEFASVPELNVIGSEDLENLSARILNLQGGPTRIHGSRISYLFAHEASAEIESVELGSVDGIYAEFKIDASTLSYLQLSYSRAFVQNCRFEGNRTYVLFHGASGGTLEYNSFLAHKTEIEVRHTSNPVFKNNNFTSDSTRVVCGTYQLPDCIHMEENWWGTPDEDRIRDNFEADCPVCYSPWLTGPVGSIRPYTPFRNAKLSGWAVNRAKVPGSVKK